MGSGEGGIGKVLALGSRFVFKQTCCKVRDVIHSPVGKDTELDAVHSDPTLKPVVCAVVLGHAVQCSQNIPCCKQLPWVADHSVWCAGNILFSQHHSDWGRQWPEVSLHIEQVKNPTAM